MTINTRVQKWGNSLGIRIPQKLARKIALYDGSEVKILERENTILIVPIASEPTLDELLSRITEDNRHNEIDFGNPSGNELFQ